MAPATMTCGLILMVYDLKTKQKQNNVCLGYGLKWDFNVYLLHKLKWFSNESLNINDCAYNSKNTCSS